MNAAIAHAGRRVIGLDGVVAQHKNYRTSGFELAYANVALRGTVAATYAPQPGVIALTEVPLAAVAACDATVSRLRPPRSCALDRLAACRRALVRDGGLPAGRDPSMPEGPEIGPWWPTPAAARRFCWRCWPAAGAGENFLDVPSVNRGTRSRWARPGARAGVRDGALYTSAIPPLCLGAGIRRHHL